MPTSNENIYVLTLRQFHRDVDCVCHHRDVVVDGKSPNNFCRRGAWCESDGFSGSDQRSGGTSDSPFFIGGTFYLRLERSVATKGLVKEWLDRHRSAMGALQ